MKYVCQWKSIDNECNCKYYVNYTEIVEDECDECRDYFNSEHIFEPTENGGLLE